MEKYPEDEEIEEDINETVSLLEEAYKVFNEVIEVGSFEDKRKATALMNSLNERLKQQVKRYDDAHDLPTQVLIDTTKDTNHPQIKELYEKSDTIKSVMKETEGLLEKQSPTKKKKKKKTGLRKKMKGLKLRRFRSKKSKK